MSASSTTAIMRRKAPPPRPRETLQIEQGTSLTIPEGNGLVVESVNSAHKAGDMVLGSGTAVPPNAEVLVATVRRNYCGTGPFDKHWLNVDCCGLFCACLTYGLHVYGVYVVCFILLPLWMSVVDELKMRHLTTAGMLNNVLFPLVAFMACYSHFLAMTTDPGAVPPDARPLPEDEEGDDEYNVEEGQVDSETDNLMRNNKPPPKKLCRRCKAYKPQRAHHCAICNRCIIKMDHHCPWVNNCVGIGNHKYFLLFVFYTFVSCCYSMILVIARFSTCFNHDVPRGVGAVGLRHRRQHFTCLDHPAQLLNVLGLLVEALLFGMFTSCMMCDQAGVVQSRLTHIDKLKGLEIRSSLSGIAEVFGDASFSRRWLSPFAKVCFPPHVRDDVMGFCCGSNSSNRSSSRGRSRHSGANSNSRSSTPLQSPSGPRNVLRSVTEIV